MVLVHLYQKKKISDGMLVHAKMSFTTGSRTKEAENSCCRCYCPWKEQIFYGGLQ